MWGQLQAHVYSCPSQDKTMQSGSWLRSLTRGKNQGYLFVAPALLFLLVFTIYPLVRAVWMSFSEVSRRGVIGNWVGFENWAKLFQDGRFFESFSRSLQFAFIGMIGALVIGVALALLLNMAWLSGRVTNGMRGLAVMPWIFSMSVAALMWGLLFHRDGLINATLIGASLVKQPIQFVGNPDWAIYSLASVFVWRITPFIMVMVLAALKSLPHELSEAAYVDGASKLQVFLRITFPLLVPFLLTLAILTLVWGVGQFDLIRIITGGGPMSSTEVVSFYIYRVGFLTQNWSYGATIGVAVFLVNIFFAMVYLFLTQRARPWD